MPRFYCPDLNDSLLDRTEAHHAAHVLRLKPGDQISAFDGKGTEVCAQLKEINRHSARFEMIETFHTPPPAVALHLGQAVLKANPMEWLIQKATELGVRSIHPILAERTVANPRDHESKRRKWLQIAVESCKQCGQNWLPEIHPPVNFQEFVQTANGALKFIGSLQPDAPSLKDVLRGAPHEADVYFTVGPEGDFTTEEIQASVTAGFQPVSLGPHILRSETAALAFASALNYEMMV